MPKSWSLFLSCEHGGYQVPAPYRKQLIPLDARDLPTHRGWDKGALAVAQRIEKAFRCPLFSSEISRLVVDLNRSAHHRSCLGVSFRDLPMAEKNEIYERFYTPYRLAAEAALAQLLKGPRGEAQLHFSVHSFTPVLRGERRQAEFGILYDPQRGSEKRWAGLLHDVLEAEFPKARIRRNYPYLGRADGFQKHLRKVFPEGRYAGFELEINQALVRTPAAQRAIAEGVTRALIALREAGHLS